MIIIREPAQEGLPPLQRQRFLRHFQQLSHHIDRGQFKQAEQCIFDYQKTRLDPETEREYWADLVDGLITEPPYLHPNEPPFLNDMIERLDDNELPTEKQASWIQKIARRRQQQ